MQATPKNLWQRLSDKPRWFYIIIWILCTAISWGTYANIIIHWQRELNELEAFGAVLDALLGVTLVGLVQSVILKLYLKKYPIALWLIVCIFWFSFTGLTGDYGKYTILFFISSIVLFCVVSVWGFKRYAEHWKRWLFVVIPVVYTLISNVFPSIFTFFYLDIMDFFGIGYIHEHPLKAYSVGLSLGLTTSLVFLTTPKDSTDTLVTS